MRPLISPIALLCLTLILSACGNNKTVSKKYFRISTTPQTQQQLKPLTLVVKRPTALSILGGRPMVATKEDQSLVQLSNHFWLESPKVLLQDILKNWAINNWQEVSFKTPHEKSHQILNTRILAFEKVQNQANVSLEFLLYDENNNLLFNKQYTHKEQLSGEGYKAFAIAIGHSIDAILLQLNQDI